MGGLTLGGGVGRLMRRFGLTVDSLLSAEVVTADGRILRTSADQHADLFWALRGGGGNFGVVTEFEFALHELSELVILATFHPLDQARRVIGQGRREMADPAADATAFPFRNARWLINIPATWRDAADDEREIGWARATYAAIRPHLSEGGYVNFMGDDEDDDTAAAYGRTIERLQRIKAVYDPDNVFRLNQNIEPAAAPG